VLLFERLSPPLPSLLFTDCLIAAPAFTDAVFLAVVDRQFEPAGNGQGQGPKTPGRVIDDGKIVRVGGPGPSWRLGALRLELILLAAAVHYSNEAGFRDRPGRSTSL
jgi:hypothetical protein